MRRAIALVALFPVLSSLAACKKNVEIAVEQEGVTIGTDDAQQLQEMNVTMPGKEVTLPQHGKEEFLSIGPVEGQNGTPVNGVASLHGFEDGATIIGVQANIAVPKEGTYYEAWLAKDLTTPEISVGHLTNPLNDVRHQARMESDKDYRSYGYILITRESDDGNPKPSGAIVAKAVLKHQSR